MKNNHYKYVDGAMNFLSMNKEYKNDIARKSQRYSLNTKQIQAIQRNNDYWQNVMLKAWSAKYRKRKARFSADVFEYLV